MLLFQEDLELQMIFPHGRYTCLFRKRLTRSLYYHGTVLLCNVPGNETQALLGGLFSAVVCGLSQRVCSQFSCKGCVCNVSPDEMTHGGQVNFYLHLFLTVMRPERCWEQPMSQLCNRSVLEILVVIIGLLRPHYCSTSWWGAA